MGIYSLLWVMMLRICFVPSTVGGPGFSNFPFRSSACSLVPVWWVRVTAVEKFGKVWVMWVCASCKTRKMNLSASKRRLKSAKVHELLLGRPRYLDLGCLRRRSTLEIHSVIVANSYLSFNHLACITIVARWRLSEGGDTIEA